MFVLNALVSALHHKFEYEGKHFDLAYITPRVIASAEPSADSFTQLYRTKVTDLERLLLSRHGRSWHVWNLQEDSELSYDPRTFALEEMADITVSRCPIRDHCPAPFYKLIELVREIQTYLRQNKKNIALIHCKCGKGRTGLVLSTYLIAEHGDTDVEANREFTRKRIRYSVVKGVSINSQLRYLRYASEFFSSGQDLQFLERGKVCIVAVSIRYPQYREFGFSVNALDGSFLGPPVRSWTIKTRHEHLIVMTPAGRRVILPADLMCEFSGRSQSGSTKPVSFSYNALFEARRSRYNEPQRCPLPFMSTPPPYGPRALSSSTLDDGIYRFRCEWEMVDGMFGTPWLGPRLFDSIEIFWREQVGDNS